VSVGSSPPHMTATKMHVGAVKSLDASRSG
jgi:hypothetical protein